jgi:hypothetical protein
MKRAKHQGLNHVTCPACITRAESQRFPWEHDYLTVFCRVRAETEYRKLHAAAIARNEKNDAMRSLGLVKVKGAWITTRRNGNE